MKVAIGSLNPVKIEATKQAFLAVWASETFQFIAIATDSGVSAQPMSDDESIQGATNRAQRALKQADAEYGVGLEGGLQKTGNHWFDCCWVVIVDKHGNQGIGSTIKLIVPEKMMALIQQGKELGEVCDMLFNKTNAKQAEGFFGLMTNNLITRTSGHRDGVIAALAPFLHPKLSRAA